ncbi:hypothetical protein ACFQ0M_27110 [Kitasatospora aburaviensis]
MTGLPVPGLPVAAVPVAARVPMAVPVRVADVVLLAVRAAVLLVIAHDDQRPPAG